jgi:undecaprenyl-diphosphatase
MAGMTPDAEIVVIAAALTLMLMLHSLSWATLGLATRAVRRSQPRLSGLRGWVRAHPWRAWLAGRSPRTYRVLNARLTPRRFTGLPLTLLIAAACYLAALLGGLVEEVMTDESIVDLDHAVNREIAAWHGPVLLAVFAWITELGASPALCAVAIVASGLLWTRLRAALVVPLWVVFLGAQATTHLGKFVFARPRPEMLEIATEWTSSFPSGHTTGAAAVYGFLAFAIARDLPFLSRMQFEVVFWAVMLILLVGFSRIYLGVHYPSDVLAGLMVGGFWLLVGFALAEWQRAREWAAARTAPPLAHRDRQGELP